MKFTIKLEESLGNLASLPKEVHPLIKRVFKDIRDEDYNRTPTDISPNSKVDSLENFSSSEDLLKLLKKYESNEKAKISAMIITNSEEASVWILSPESKESNIKSTSKLQKVLFYDNSKSTHVKTSFDTFIGYKPTRWGSTQKIFKTTSYQIRNIPLSDNNNAYVICRDPSLEEIRKNREENAKNSDPLSPRKDYYGRETGQSVLLNTLKDKASDLRKQRTLEKTNSFADASCKKVLDLISKYVGVSLDIGAINRGQGRSRSGIEIITKSLMQHVKLKEWVDQINVVVDLDLKDSGDYSLRASYSYKHPSGGGNGVSILSCILDPITMSLSEIHMNW